MGLKDIKLLALTLIPVLLLVTLAALAPIYHMPNGAYERHWVWNAPVIQVRHGYDDLTQADIERLSADPHQRKIVEGLKNLPRTVPISPNYIGFRTGPGRNVLGYLAMMSVFAWLGLFGYKWFNR